MSWLALIKSMFAPPPVFANATKLGAKTKEALFQSLANLSAEDRGWISFAEACALFSKASAEYAFGEKDEAGKQDLADFAARAGCQPQFMPSEGRLYLSRTR